MKRNYIHKTFLAGFLFVSSVLGLPSNHFTSFNANALPQSKTTIAPVAFLPVSFVVGENHQVLAQSSILDINGKWRGRYLCGQGFTGVTLTIKQIKTDVIAEFDLYPLPENPNVPRGVALFQGSFNPATGEMILRGVKWLKKPAPGWTIVDFSGKFNSQLNSFSGKKLNSGCGNIDLVRIENTEEPAKRF